MGEAVSRRGLCHNDVVWLGGRRRSCPNGTVACRILAMGELRLGGSGTVVGSRYFGGSRLLLARQGGAEIRRAREHRHGGQVELQQCREYRQQGPPSGSEEGSREKLLSMCSLEVLSSRVLSNDGPRPVRDTECSYSQGLRRQQTGTASTEAVTEERTQLSTG